jgi:WD40 repeat protein/serine/threonine protein kinase
MNRRADASGDLLFGLLALEHGLIDQARLTAAFRIWREARTGAIAEILLRQGALDQAGKAFVDELVARQLERWDTASAEDNDDPDRTIGYGSSTPGPMPVGERFRIVRHHARGGLGEVFLARDPELDRTVALKELQAFHAYDPLSQARFLLEAKLTGRLEHPGIVPVYGLGRYADGRPYYAMRFIEGETLSQAIERFHQLGNAQSEPAQRELAFRRLLSSLIDACNAVAYAHSRGVVHRDLKPENIMLGRFGETLVVDWGIAKTLADSHSEPAASTSLGAAAAEVSLTSPGTAIGTPQYMSPEQASGQLKRVGPASDVYSLGATLYCLLVGHGPFPSGGVADVLVRVGRGVFPAPRSLRRAIDPALEAICLKAMSLEPEDRHSSPLELAGEIEAFLADVRYRSEQERALSDAKRSVASLCIERARNLFGREMSSEGMLWLARALENVPSDAPGAERALRASLAGWYAAAKLLERTLAHDGAVRAVAFGVDGRSLASASDDRTAQLWDVAKGGRLSPPMRHQGKVNALDLSPDGSFLATASDDGMLRRFNALTGAPIGDPIHVGACVRAVRISPDCLTIAAASQLTLPCLWSAATGKPIGHASADGEAQVLDIAFHPDGSRLALAGDDGRVWFRETATGAVLGQTLRHAAAVPALRFSPEGDRLLCACLDGRARLWDSRTLLIAGELAHAGAVGCIAFSPSGRAVATGSHDRTARLWDSDSKRPIGEPLGHRGRVDCLAFSADGSTVATGSEDGSVRLWDAATGLPIGPPLAHRGAVLAVALSPDGRRLATGCSDGKLRSWRVPAPVVGTAERIACWVRILTELEFDEGDAIRRIDPLVVWELRRRLQDLGGAPVK